MGQRHTLGNGYVTQIGSCPIGGVSTRRNKLCVGLCILARGRGGVVEKRAALCQPVVSSSAPWPKAPKISFPIGFANSLGEVAAKPSLVVGHYQMTT